MIIVILALVCWTIAAICATIGFFSAIKNKKKTAIISFGIGTLAVLTWIFGALFYF
ncbi:hypothetical protein AWH56_001780 [Anaerobacillus isosaccharinicus]|uniref:DUF2759 domain-containing protein n=1 Tax=Anaerobacillus isosaccharinicus TaxID=1532552 RepID=A0A7S7L8K4_9BACI|nr:hypothetical protein [Anaerobacillus isosaccharinicus]MBA5585216.1 hypothetical protein [Anaerobacillus isosaccharinicus]QOY36449.1 hypothetical protein AWH56_001780 [Anaerobacillus isosaccharinicus]